MHTKRILTTALLFILSLIAVIVTTQTETVGAQSSSSPLSGTPIPAVYFRVGAGFTDVIPRQLVRTADDRVYIVAGNAQGSNRINVYWMPNPGLPNSAADFSGSTSLTDSDNPISVEAVYDGTQIIHVFANNQSGVLNDFPFDTSTNTFKATKVISTGDPTVSGGYIGSSGVSGMFDKSGILHLAYWTGGDHIVYAEYTYNVGADTLTRTSGPTQLDNGSGVFRHPSLVISPYDNSLAVGWTQRGTPNSGFYDAGNILVRKRDRNGVWGAQVQVNSAAAWTSDESGADIDQGPQMVVTSDGVYHLVYIEYAATFAAYGHVHYVVQNANGTWTDTPIAFYTHDPALATTTTNALYIFGHGDTLNANCTSSNMQICVVAQNSNGTWAAPQVFASGSGSDSFDSSPSVKWSVVGWNRPDTVEFLFFSANGNSYFNTSVWYARIGAPAAAAHKDTIGVYRSGNFYLRLHNNTGNADITVTYNPATKPYPVVGDWTGAQVDTVGVFDQNNGQFALCTANNTATCASGGSNVIKFTLGNPNDVPLAGKWAQGIVHFGGGIFRPTNGLIYLKNNLTTGFADYTMVLGIPGDQGLVGDWTGKDFDSPGVYRPVISIFYLSDQITNGSVFGNISLVYGIPGDKAVAGDWVVQGHDGIGLFRQSNGYTYLRNTLTSGYADNSFTYGIAGDVPIAGHWQSSYPPVPSAPILIPQNAFATPNGNGGSVPNGDQIGD